MSFDSFVQAYTKSKEMKKERQKIRKNGPRVLVACEMFGAVRDAFLAVGFNAVSCDIMPTRVPGPHIEGDVLLAIAKDPNWDLMIAFPPCTHLAVSGAHLFKAKRADGRQQQALAFVQQLMDAPIPRIAIENPVGIISSAIRKPDQIIQPFEYGHPESKKTCLWLKDLPKLVPTDVLPKPARGYWDNQTPSGQNKLGPSEDRAALRGKTYDGIAKAMAAQWGLKLL